MIATSSSPTPPPTSFITGGSGYVGRNLIRHWIAQGTEVRALVRSPEAAARVTALGAIPVDGDLTSTHWESSLLGCNWLIHAAADTDHGRGGLRQRTVNVDGTRQVLSAARRAGVQRVLHISTESVLLDGRALRQAKEDSPYPARPAGSYSATKAEAERLALSLAAPGFEVIVLRPRFIWGRDDTTALPQLMQAVSSGQFAWIAGGHYLSSTTHIANLCAAAQRALERGRSGGVYFASDGPPVEFREFVTRLLDTQGMAVPDKSVPRALVRVMASVGDALTAISRGRIRPPIGLQQYATSAVEVTVDIGKAQRELGYAPVLTRDEGLTEMRAAFDATRRHAAQETIAS